MDFNDQQLPISDTTVAGEGSYETNEQSLGSSSVWNSLN